MTNEFTWRKISDKERDDIKKQAKGIMDSFASKLEKVEKEIVELNQLVKEEVEAELAEMSKLEITRLLKEKEALAEELAVQPCL